MSAPSGAGRRAPAAPPHLEIRALAIRYGAIRAVLDNVVLTPHVGAGTLDAFRTKMRFALGNIRRVVQGEPPLERVPGT
jgi:lactate dehydrogenase-like 2-hydroxyacid dehydrogenase